jgi:hypothetical protein
MKKNKQNDASYLDILPAYKSSHKCSGKNVRGFVKIFEG